MYRVKINAARPDYRVFIDLLYGNERDVDTDGNSIPVNSRNWTCLYIKDRDGGDPCLNIFACDSDETRFEVTSDAPQLEELAALYLYLYCGSVITYIDKNLIFEDIQKLKDLYASQLRRAENSIWHKSTNVAPYPNRA